MKLLELRKGIFAAMLLAFMASTVLPACSSTDEAAQPEDTGGSQAGCEGLPPDQMEDCIQDLPL